jgi:uncharacterized protein YuzE
MEENTMATIKIPLESKSVISYDSEADVLYVSFGKPRRAEGIDIGDGTILRIDPETQEVVGITLLDFRKRVEKEN